MDVEEEVPVACNPSVVPALSARIAEACCVEVVEEVLAFCNPSLVFLLSAGIAEACSVEVEEGVPTAWGGIAGASLRCCWWDKEVGFKASGR